MPNTGTGNKFDFDGQALRYRGNSIISHIPQSTSFYQNLLKFQQEIQRSALGDRHIFLPKNSLHITLFNGVNENIAQRNKVGYWPADVPKNAEISDVHRHLLNKLSQSNLELPDKLLFRPTELWTPFDKKGITLGVELVDDRQKHSIIELRKHLNQLFETQRNSPENLNFHISLGYTWKVYSPTLMSWAEEQRLIWSKHFLEKNPTFEIDTIEFAVFDDMLSYSPIWLKKLKA
ncbi:DUF1868 domain-containing protein [Avibacterium sp. 21-594]|uniref:DUF1868 domain-containing protein n=1 Tax=Avibacterium sp. 21-594 TaxID=2911535 RepID=UPI0022481FCD|nr:DUF1868 domain-containing protein [Avibacterium sp. 21-594]MCW9715264.1 DUF1868 domain-containing protein [Avibacterium sp. 21-594]